MVAVAGTVTIVRSNCGEGGRLLDTAGFRGVMII